MKITCYLIIKEKEHLIDHHCNRIGVLIKRELASQNRGAHKQKHIRGGEEGGRVFILEGGRSLNKIITALNEVSFGVKNYSYTLSF